MAADIRGHGQGSSPMDVHSLEARGHHSESCKRRERRLDHIKNAWEEVPFAPCGHI